MVHFIWKTRMAIGSIPPMLKLLLVLLSLFAATPPTDLPTKKYLDLASIKTMVTAAEAEAKKRNVEVTICVVDESGNLLFLEKADAAPLNTIEFAQKKARHAAFYKSPSKDGADALKKRQCRGPRFSGLFPEPGWTAHSG
jgi:glc operon protein GlcG